MYLWQPHIAHQKDATQFFTSKLETYLWSTSFFYNHTAISLDSPFVLYSIESNFDIKIFQ